MRPRLDPRRRKLDVPLRRGPSYAARVSAVMPRRVALQVAIVAVRATDDPSARDEPFEP
jgi:hypothetical protein